MKTFKEWDGYIEDYLEINDEVDFELVQHFANILPPTTYSTHLIQGGSVDDYVNGKATYITFEKVDNKWYYRGACHRGEVLIP